MKAHSSSSKAKCSYLLPRRNLGVTQPNATISRSHARRKKALSLFVSLVKIGTDLIHHYL